MATEKQRATTRRKARTAAPSTRAKTSMASGRTPARRATRTSTGTASRAPGGTAPGRPGAAAQGNRAGASSPKTRRELYEEARRRNIHGRSTMVRDELARALGYRR